MRRTFIWVFALLAIAAISYLSLAKTKGAESNSAHLSQVNPDKVNWQKKSDRFWRKNLTELQYRVCRQGGTEYPFTGQLLKKKGKGTYVCSSCGQPLFSSETKFKSGTGWPSYYRSIRKGAIKYLSDRSHGMVRTEIKCSRCDAHLGHVFDDGPAPTGKRYCVNSVCLLFQPQ